MRTYVATVYVANDGEYEVFVANNKTLEGFNLLFTVNVPRFLSERIALVKLMDNGEEGDLIGRRITSQMLHVYLNRHEFNELKSKNRSAK